MNDTPPICGPGESGNGSSEDSPPPGGYQLPEGQHVAMDPGSIYALGYNMAGRLTDYDAQAEVIAKQLKNNTSTEGGSSCEVLPIGGDPRWEHVRNASEYHTASMEGNQKLIENFRIGMDRVSRITRLIVHNIGGTDSQNNMTLHDLEDATGLNQSNAKAVDYTGNPGNIDDNQTGLPPWMAPR